MINLKKNRKATHVSAVDILRASHPEKMSIEERANLTISCKDAASLPKVRDAGKVVTQRGKKVQIMHNGVKVLAGGYYGELIVPIIEALNGHHEPQEEKVFYHILKRIHKEKPNMIELGSHWAYYSLWFKHDFPGGLNICCEPDPHNIEIGRENYTLNRYKGVIFYQSLAGAEDKKVVSFSLDSNPNESLDLPIRTVDSIGEEQKIDYIDILHMDVQGAELDALEGALDTIASKRIRFLVVSTHHYVFSGDPLTHQKCLDFIVKHGGHIIAEHSVLESFSGDGLIAASFDPRDFKMEVKISLNHSNNSLYRPYEEDLAVLVNAYDKSLK